MGERYRNANWTVNQNPDTDGAQLCVLMDIRDELRFLNNLLGCSNFRGIPVVLKEIRKNTTKRKREAKTKK